MCICKSDTKHMCFWFAYELNFAFVCSLPSSILLKCCDMYSTFMFVSSTGMYPYPRTIYFGLFLFPICRTIQSTANYWSALPLKRAPCICSYRNLLSGLFEKRVWSVGEFFQYDRCVYNPIDDDVAPNAMFANDNRAGLNADDSKRFYAAREELVISAGVELTSISIFGRNK